MADDPIQYEQGVVAAVEEELAETELVVAVAAGAAVLQLLDAVDFNEDGGSLVLDGDTPELVAYASADLEADTVTLATPLAGPHPEGTPVRPAPDVVERRALVQVDGSDDSLDARVPHALYDRLEVGTRYQDAEYVSLSLDGSEWVVEDVLGREPVIDGRYINPDTLPEVELPPIGPTEPPSSSPTLAAAGADSAITLVAEGVVDPTTVLDYYMNGALLESTRSTVVVVRALPDGGELDPDATYDFWVVARNELGAAPASNTVNAGLNPAVTAEQIMASVAAGFVLAGQIQVGNITIDPDDGITIPLASGGDIRFPADGSPAIIDAILRTHDLTVRGGLTINGVTNYVNGKLYLASGTANPQSPVDLNWTGTREVRRFPQVTAAGTGASGLARTADGAYWGAIIHLPTGNEKRFVVVDNASGQVVASVHSDDALVDWRSVTAVGQTFYVMGVRYNSNQGRSEYILHRYSTSGSQQGGWFPGDSAGNRIAPLTSNYWDGAITYEVASNSLWLARTLSGGTVRWYRYGLNSSGAFQSPVADSYLTTSGARVTLVRSAYVGPGDFGSQRFLIGGWSADQSYGVLAFGADGVFRAADSWAVNKEYPGGLMWDAASSRFLMCDRDTTSLWVGEYSAERSDRTVYGQVTWYDNNPSGGNKESAPSPLNSRLIPRRAFPQVAVPAPPNPGEGDNDPNAVRVYLDTDTTTRLLTTITTGKATTYVSATLAGPGGGPPLTSSFPSASVTGELASASGADFFRGTGAFRFGGIQGSGDGRTVVPDGSKISGFVPTGSMVMFGGLTAPSGWLVCDGSNLSTALYPELFAVLGYSFGGSGSTFKLPDLRRRFPWGHEPSGNPLGQSDALAAEERSPAHIHDSGSLAVGRPSTAPANTWNTPNTGSNTVPRTAQFDNHTHATEGSTAGSSFITTAVANKTFPNLSVTFIIKT